ncbi:MAG: hypothetical protein NC489_39075 [Ruminococcus flavefaciens]|nr:hypothetical protein [Ruminococcus flavefaciens]
MEINMGSVREIDSIGGYIELDSYCLPMLHEGAVALNCGRNCLRYLIWSKKIKNILLPYFLCDSVRNLCLDEQVNIRDYHIDETFLPLGVSIGDDEWIYIVNYYGQLSNDDIVKCKKQYDRIIVDNTQAYFSKPVEGIDTIYTCRKFFGVPDGAFLYTDVILDEKLEKDESYERMSFILGRYERPASEFYDLYVKNNELFDTEPVKEMSYLTDNLLHGIDYNAVKEKRTQNYGYLFEHLERINQLDLKKIEGAFAYPLLISGGGKTKREMIKEKIYIPTLWPNVLSDVEAGSLEYRFAMDILPIPCDQRYGHNEMEKICDLLEKLIK